MKEAISYYKKLGPEYRDQIGSGLFNICTCYRYSSLYDSAVVYGLSSLDILQDHYGGMHADLLLPYICLTSTYVDQGDLHRAQAFLEEGISLLSSLGWTPEDPSVDAYMQDVLYMLGSAIKWSRAKYLKTGRPDDLQSALNRGEDFMKTVDYAYDYIKNSISRDVLQGQFKTYVHALIDNQFLAYEVSGEESAISQAFRILRKV